MSKYTKRQLKNWKGKQSAKKRIRINEQIDRLIENPEEAEKNNPDE